MHPILTDTKKHVLYLVLWGAVGTLAGFSISSVNNFAPLYSIVFTLPMLLLYGEVNLSTWYLCRAFPLERTPLWKVLAISTVTVIFVSALWTLLGWGVMMMIEQSFAVTVSPLPLNQSLVIIFIIGAPFVLISLAVGYLIAAFDRTKESERNAYEARLLAQQAELKALRMQIDPHFLFNCLNSISALTMTNAALARTMTTTLADFFRKSLSYGAKETITLKEELSLLNHYLDIEKIRFGKRLSVVVSIDPDTESDQIPPLLLQPLVENAIKHGISDSVEGGTVTVTTQKKQGRLFIIVENPMDHDAPKKKGAGMGMEIVRQRLQTVYGSDGDVKMAINNNQFQVILFLPSITHQ